MGRLNARQVESIKAPGRHGDGAGLYLVVQRTGAKSWILRTTLRGRRVDLGLGPVHALSLADARDKARRWRALAWDGKDPREVERRDGMTLRSAAAEFHAAHRASWSHGHAVRWWGQLERHVFDKIGDRPLGEIEAADLVTALSPVWTEKNDTARRLLQRLVAVYESAIASGTHTGPNPTTGLLRVLPRVRPEVEHFGAMDWHLLPEFYAELVERDAIAARCLRFIILTACRGGEARGATWDEIDLEAGLWTIPARRMKARRPHEVPLSPDALAILEGMRGLSPALVFPSPQSGDGTRPMTSAAIERLLGRMRREGITSHGFRTSFRSWAADHGADREIAELSLGHRIGNAVEQSYQRSAILDRRRVLIERWAAHVTGTAGATVVNMR
ncbi:tyrosine-type recombinase/integrase [Salibaculum sp.]|uniref:tyrosine-type recombinase/integrase n=1 Tax=Salibaculum sp. TaxID=2855480 RepID=UPI002B4A826E|nr:integrase arm-type DNA-binding domain-containing protein [Salibaculum sp.]HKL70857.1 integrase arm-type DNA-binding domain-containing protein [Salibaculum sp.]